MRRLHTGCASLLWLAAAAANDAFWSRPSGWVPTPEWDGKSVRCTRRYAVRIGHTAPWHIRGCMNEVTRRSLSGSVLVQLSRADCAQSCLEHSSLLSWGPGNGTQRGVVPPEVSTATHVAGPTVTVFNTTFQVLASPSNPVGSSGRCVGAFEYDDNLAQQPAAIRLKPVFKMIDGVHRIYHHGGIWRCTAGSLADPSAGAEMCSTPTSGMPYDDGVVFSISCNALKFGIAKATATSLLPLRKVAAVWRSSDQKCQCLDVGSVPEDTEYNGGCREWEILYLPLACLFTGDAKCIAARGDCLYDSRGCCVDAAGDLSSPGEEIGNWMWFVVATCCGLSGLILLFVFLFGRTRVFELQRPRYDDRVVRAVAAISAAARGRGGRQTEDHVFAMLAAVMAQVPRSPQPVGADGADEPCSICLETGDKGADGLCPVDEDALMRARRVLVSTLCDGGSGAEPYGDAADTGDRSGITLARADSDGTHDSRLDMVPESLLVDLGELETDANGWGELPCGHRLHRACLEQWFLSEARGSTRIRSKDPTCPLCRAIIPEYVELFETVSRVATALADAPPAEPVPVAAPAPAAAPAEVEMVDQEPPPAAAEPAADPDAVGHSSPSGRSSPGAAHV